MTPSDALASLRPRPSGPPLRGRAARSEGIIKMRLFAAKNTNRTDADSTLNSLGRGLRLGVGAELTLLKTDILGRIRTPTDQREALMDLFEQSGMSGATFSKHHGLRYTTFANWRQKRRRERIARGEKDPPKPPPPVQASPFRFQEVTVDSLGPSSTGLVVELCSGARMTIEHCAQIPLAVEFIKHMQEPVRC